MEYRVEKISFGYYVQRLSVVNFDGILDHDWRDCALLPQDDYPDAAVLRIHPTAILGGKKVMCTYEVSNVGEMYPDSIINCAFCSATVIPEYKQHRRY